MRQTCWLIITTVAALWTIHCESSNILGLFPHHGYSHFKVYYPILRSLANRGHNVTVVTYIKSPETLPNYEEMLLTQKETINNATFDEFTPTRSLTVLLQETFELHNEGQESCQIFYESGIVQELLERHKHTPFDLVIMEFFNTDCYLAIPHLMQLPVIGVSSCALMPWYYDRIALPDFPSYVQSEFVGFPEVLNWQERLLNFVQAHTNKLVYRYYTNQHDNKLIKRYLHINVDVNEIAQRLTSLIFVNQHYTIAGNRPFTPQLIEMGGIHVIGEEQQTALPVEIHEFLMNSTTDVLLVSFGSMLRMSSIIASKLEAIIAAIQQLPINVIWKWESNTKPVQSEQFLFVKWLPQQELLCHPKVKWFWGHGGLLGVTEAVHCGKPLIVTPIYGDQFLNSNAVRNRNIAVILPYNDIDERSVMQALQAIMQPRYVLNAQDVSRIFKNRETSPLQTTLWWIEHLVRDKRRAHKLLQTKAAQLNWFFYYSLDSIMLLLAVPTILLTLFFFLIRKLCAMRNCGTKIKQN